MNKKETSQNYYAKKGEEKYFPIKNWKKKLIL